MRIFNLLVFLAQSIQASNSVIYQGYQDTSAVYKTWARYLNLVAKCNTKILMRQVKVMLGLCVWQLRSF